MTTQPIDIRSLKRVRLYASLCFWTGIAVSLAANVLHAEPNFVSQAVAAWAPIALLLAVELLSRVPVTVRSARSWLRMIATGVVAAIAAWVSYWHMVGVAAEYGETDLTPYLLPISVDGLVVIASISLVEINHRIRATTTPTGNPAHTDPQPATKPTPAPPPTPATDPEPITNPEPAPVPIATEPPTNPAPVATHHLLPQARLIATAHHKATGQPITAADLAARINTSETVARELLATIHPDPMPAQPASATHNGVPVSAGVTSETLW